MIDKKTILWIKVDKEDYVLYCGKKNFENFKLIIILFIKKY